MEQLIAILKATYILITGSGKLIWFLFNQQCRSLDALIDDLFKDLI